MSSYKGLSIVILSQVYIFVYSHKYPMPEIAIIGGSGLYSADELKNIEEVKIHTPYGKPSDNIIIGTFNGMKIAFLSRHGA